MNFITDNEILKAHTVARTNQTSRTFLRQLTVQGVVSTHPRLPVAYNCCVSVFSKQMQDRPNNIATDWWDLHMQIRYSTSATGWPRCWVWVWVFYARIVKSETKYCVFPNGMITWNFLKVKGSYSMFKNMVRNFSLRKISANIDAERHCDYIFFLTCIFCFSSVIVFGFK